MQKIKKAEPRSTVPLSSLFLYLLHPQNPTLKINPAKKPSPQCQVRDRKKAQTIWFGPSAIHTTMVSQSESFSGSEGDDGTAKELKEKIKSNTTTTDK